MSILGWAESHFGAHSALTSPGHHSAQVTYIEVSDSHPCFIQADEVPLWKSIFGWVMSVAVLAVFAPVTMTAWEVILGHLGAV